MCLQRKTICDECKKDTDGLMTCTFTDGERIRLCPDCLEADGSFCLRCGEFCSGLESFDFIHPGYCDNCWDEIRAQNDDWECDEEEYNPFADDDSEDEFRNGSLDY